MFQYWFVCLTGEGGEGGKWGQAVQPPLTPPSTNAASLDQLINNFIGQAITTATAEGLATAAKTGLDTRALFRVLSSGSVDNKMMSFMIEPMLNAKGDEKREGRTRKGVRRTCCRPAQIPSTSHRSVRPALQPV